MARTRAAGSDQVSDVHGHLVDVGAVELLNLAHGTDVVSSDKVDRNTLAPETTSTTNSDVCESSARGLLGCTHLWM